MHGDGIVQTTTVKSWSEKFGVVTETRTLEGRISQDVLVQVQSRAPLKTRQ